MLEEFEEKSMTALYDQTFRPYWKFSLLVGFEFD